MNSLILALLGASGAAAPQEPLAAHPADAAVRFQIPDVTAVLAAYETTAYARILADTGLHDSVGQVLGAGGPIDPRDLLVQQWGQALEQGAPPVDKLAEALRAVSFSVSVPDGDLAAFFGGMEHADDPEARAAEQLTLRMVLDFHDAAGAAAMLEALMKGLGEQGAEYEAQELPAAGGVFGASPLTRLSFLGDDGPFAATVRLIAGGSRVALLAGAESDAVAVARMAGDASGAENSAAALRRPFAAAAGAVVFEAHINPFVERLLNSQEPMALPVLDLVEGLAGPLASLAIRGGDWRVQLVDGEFVTEGVYPKPAPSPLAGLFGAKALDPEDVALVLPDATIAWAVSLDKNVLQRLLAGVVEREGGEDMLAELDTRYGFRPDRDLIAPLGDALAYSLPPITSMLSAPPFTVSLDVADLDAFTKGMDGVFTLLEAEGGDEFQLTRSEYKGVRMYTLSFAGADSASGPFAGLPINPAAMFRPTIAIGQGRAFLITTPNLAKKEVRRVDKLAGELELHPALSGAGLPKGATEVGYADWGDFFGKLYSGLKGLAPMLGGLVGDLPFDLAALPDAEVITKYIRPSQRSKSLAGETVHVLGRSSFGPEMAFALAGGAGAGGMVVGTTSRAQVYEEEWDEPVPIEPLGYGGGEEGEVIEVEEGVPTELLLTQDTLLSLRVDLTVYRFDHGQYPASLEALGADAPLDGWGHALVYSAQKDGFKLYSVGPNGVDDAGAGDDILPPE